VKLAVCQLSVTAEKQKNIDHAREVIEKAAHDGAKLIVLPVGVPSVTPHQDTNVLLLASATHIDRVMKDRAQLYGSAILLGCENKLLVFEKRNSLVCS
jgi:predicted amidohydrolase